ncbi:hypothetical protein [Alterisphingorhabdus coralli]|uniref:Uncharacterized protein n=1 Tax=Alterisphingorhabdus coralli TaxID=3071408 RepID=A0AA97HYZ1_9SPHN|nr:hypothetical protein [Parasphingorhabdus sp. SCSIO 66989]WOE74029.1 hypothetical protein RB602_09160 [Parasphingorhabdus sp. SCSIO 66989]
MSEWDNISLVHSIGALVLVGSALLAYRLPLGKALRMAAIWVLIFGAAFLAVSFFQSYSAEDAAPPSNDEDSVGPWVHETTRHRLLSVRDNC